MNWEQVSVLLLLSIIAQPILDVNSNEIQFCTNEKQKQKQKQLAIISSLFDLPIITHFFFFLLHYLNYNGFQFKTLNNNLVKITTLYLKLASQNCYICFVLFYLSVRHIYKITSVRAHLSARIFFVFVSA